MKLNPTVLAAMLAGILLAGCETSTALNKVHIGMSKTEVQSLLGTPDSTSAQANVEYMTYYLSSDAGYGRDQPYMVRLVNGKVESFGRFAQLFDLYNRPVTNARPGDPNFPPGAGLGTTTIMAPAPAASSGTDIASQLQKLKALKDQGVLTDEEFQKAKEKVLSDQK